LQEIEAANPLRWQDSNTWSGVELSCCPCGKVSTLHFLIKNPRLIRWRRGERQHWRQSRS